MRSNSNLKGSTVAQTGANPASNCEDNQQSEIFSRQVTPIRQDPNKRLDRFGVLIERGKKTHKMCFADDRPNGKTSGVLLVKTYNVESFKEYNKLAERNIKD